MRGLGDAVQVGSLNAMLGIGSLYREGLMCYSATASFATAGLLLPLGALATIRAIRVNHRYLVLALTPVFFGLQQMIEGLVWQGVSNDQQAQAAGWAYLYLFFAYFFWPIFMPAAVYFTETNLYRAKWIYHLITLGVVLGLLMYGPISMGFVPIEVSVLGHSLLYTTYQHPSIAYVYGFFYIMTSSLPFMLSTRLKLKAVGAVIFASMLLSWAVYTYAFTSIWCYFVALISLWVIFSIE